MTRQRLLIALWIIIPLAFVVVIILKSVQFKPFASTLFDPSNSRNQAPLSQTGNTGHSFAVLDSKGKGIKDILVSVAGYDEQTQQFLSDNADHNYTDVDGIVIFDSLTPGNYFASFFLDNKPVTFGDTDIAFTVKTGRLSKETLVYLPPTDSSVPSPLPSSFPRPTYQCIDHIDNDRDGKTDYPTDPGCSDGLDNDERDATPPPATAITAPSLLSAQYSSNIILGKKVTLTWTDKSNNEQGFEIQRGETSDPSSFGTVGRVNANVKTYDDRSILPGKRYYYRVRAYANQGGRIVYSDSNVLAVQTR